MPGAVLSTYRVFPKICSHVGHNYPKNGTGNKNREIFLNPQEVLFLMDTENEKIGGFIILRGTSQTWEHFLGHPVVVAASLYGP